MRIDPRDEFQRHLLRVAQWAGPRDASLELQRVRCRILARYAGEEAVTDAELTLLTISDNQDVCALAVQLLDERRGRAAPAEVHSMSGRTVRKSR